MAGELLFDVATYQDAVFNLRPDKLHISLSLKQEVCYLKINKMVGCL